MQDILAGVWATSQGKLILGACGAGILANALPMLMSSLNAGQEGQYARYALKLLALALCLSAAWMSANQAWALLKK